MTVSSVHVLHSLVADSTEYMNVEDLTPTFNNDRLVKMAAGHPHPLFVSNRAHNPVIEMATMQVGDLLTQLGVTGAGIEDGGAGPYVDLHYKQIDELGDRVADGSANNLRLRAHKVFAFIESIRAAHQGEAVALSRWIPVYDGTNDPLTASGVAVAGTPAAATNFALGPIKINGSTVAGFQEMTLTTNAEPIVLGDESNIFPTFAAFAKDEPVVDLTGNLADLLTTYNLTGSALTALTIYLVKKDADGNNIVEGTAEHIALTASDGTIDLVNVRPNEAQPATPALRLTLRAADSTSTAWGATVNTAITT